MQVSFTLGMSPTPYLNMSSFSTKSLPMGRIMTRSNRAIYHKLLLKSIRQLMWINIRSMTATLTTRSLTSYWLWETKKFSSLVKRNRICVTQIFFLRIMSEVLLTIWMVIHLITMERTITTNIIEPIQAIRLKKAMCHLEWIFKIMIHRSNKLKTRMNLLTITSRLDNKTSHPE